MAVPVASGKGRAQLTLSEHRKFVRRLAGLPSESNNVITESPMSNAIIRPMTNSDIPGVAGWMVATRLWQRYRLAKTKTQAALAEGLRRSDIMLVADIVHLPACGLAWCVPGGAFGRSAYLRILGVKPDLTGRGLGTALLREVEYVAARTSGEMFLLVSDFNRAAQRFYRRGGYTQAGELPAYVLPDVAELIFWKRLPAQESPGENKEV